MIVRNEERNLPRCLKSLQGFVDEICVVDTGSTDSTPAILKDFGARTEVFPWNGHEGDARNRSLALASGRWVFILDADEEISPELGKEIREKLPGIDQENTVHSLSLIQKDHYADHSTSLYRVVRMGRKHPGLRFQGRIHPRATFLGPSAELSGVFHHYGYIWTPEQRHIKAERILASTRTEVEKPDVSTDTLCQHLTAAILAGDEGEISKTLTRIQTTPSAERLRNPYWSQALANLFQLRVRQDALDSCASLATELHDAAPLDISSSFFLLQMAIKKRSWEQVAELSRRVLASLEQPLRFGMLAFPEQQRPCSEAWLWLSDKAQGRENGAVFPRHTRAIPSIAHILRTSSKVRQELGHASTLLSSTLLLLSPHASLDRMGLMLGDLENALDPEKSKGFDHLLQLLLLGDISFRLGKTLLAIRAAKGLIDAYPDHLWLMKALHNNPFERPFWSEPWEEKVLHLP